MPTLAIRFPARRLHATPWGSHVNEGLVEWPPSPWRLLRALIGCGFSALDWRGSVEPGRVLLEALASCVPSYRLPSAVSTHTRHYMPVREGRLDKPAKILDAHLRFTDEAPLLVHWPCALGDPDRDLLRRLAEALPYLGRAESWVDASLIDDCVVDAQWASPVVAEVGAPRQPGESIVTLLAPMTPQAFPLWRATVVNRPESAAKKRGTRGRVVDVPKDVLDCLTLDTAWLQRGGWSQPPGSRWIQIRVPPAQQTRPTRSVRRAPRTVDAALIALSSETPTGRVLPSFSRCLPTAECLHATAVSKLALRGVGSDAASCLTGRDETGRRLEGHRHARIVPIDMDGDDRIDHILVHAQMGLSPEAVDALASVDQIYAKNIPHEIRSTLVGTGTLDEVLGPLLRSRDAMRLQQFGRGTRWTSLTPLVLPRHIKAKRHSPADQIRAELAAFGLPIADIRFRGRNELVSRGFYRFVRQRRDNKPQPPSTCPYAVDLIFDEPIVGPLSLGYGAHFGLGVFVRCSTA
ncbi:MAG: type I-U CRISPR-associated protein Csb2 [Phycisphaerales bacterium]